MKRLTFIALVLTMFSANAKQDESSTIFMLETYRSLSSDYRETILSTIPPKSIAEEKSLKEWERYFYTLETARSVALNMSCPNTKYDAAYLMGARQRVLSTDLPLENALLYYTEIITSLDGAERHNLCLDAINSKILFHYVLPYAIPETYIPLPEIYEEIFPIVIDNSEELSQEEWEKRFLMAESFRNSSISLNCGLRDLKLGYKVNHEYFKHNRIAGGKTYSEVISEIGFDEISQKQNLFYAKNVKDYSEANSIMFDLLCESALETGIIVKK